MAQNTCMYGCRLVLPKLKFNISSISRFMKPRMGIIDGFLLQHHQFLTNKFLLWRKVDSFWGCFCPKHIYAWLQTRIILFHSQYWLIGKVHEAWNGYHWKISGTTSPFSTKPIPIYEENRKVSWLLWPKTHACMIVDWYCTSLNSILVHYQVSWSLG